MLSLGNILQNKHSQSPLIRGVKAAMLVEEANKIIEQIWGEAGKKYARALYVKSGILTIACLSASMAQEIKLRESEILRKMNPTPSIKNIEKVRCLS